MSGPGPWEEPGRNTYNLFIISVLSTQSSVLSTFFLSAEGALDPLTAFRGKPGRQRGFLILQSLGMAPECVPDEPHLITVASAQDTHEEMHPQPHAMIPRQASIQ